MACETQRSDPGAPRAANAPARAIGVCFESLILLRMAPSPSPRLLRVLLVLALDAVLLMLGLGGLAALLHEPRALALLAVWGIGGAALAARAPVRGQDVEEGADVVPTTHLLAVGDEELGRAVRESEQIEEAGELEQLAGG